MYLLFRLRESSQIGIFYWVAALLICFFFNILLLFLHFYNGSGTSAANSVFNQFRQVVEEVHDNNKIFE